MHIYKGIISMIIILLNTRLHYSSMILVSQNCFRNLYIDNQYTFLTNGSWLFC